MSLTKLLSSTAALAVGLSLATPAAAQTVYDTGTQDPLIAQAQTDISNLQTADTNLQTNIDNEAVTRATEDANLQGQIDAHTTAIGNLQAADVTLQTNIDNEAVARANADTTLQNNIDAEATARTAADVTLQANIDSETTARAAADVTLQANIDAEATTRAAADTVHSAAIAQINTELHGTSIAFGAGSTATVNAVAIGVGQTAIGNGAVAIGDPNVAIGTGAVAIGADNMATGEGAVALGDNNVANGLGAVALGNNSSAIGEGSVAIGDAAIAGTNGVALGNGASNGAFTNSVALGAASVNTANNQVHVGGRTIAGVAAGALNATSNDAVNGSQLFATNQVVATHTAQLAAITTGIAGIQADIGTLFDLRETDRRDMKQGIAGAVAMANAPMPSNPGGVSYAVNGATFRGEYAVGGSINYRLNTEKPMALGVGVSYAGNKNNSVRVGVAGEF